MNTTFDQHTFINIKKHLNIKKIPGGSEKFLDVSKPVGLALFTDLYKLTMHM